MRQNNLKMRQSSAACDLEFFLTAQQLRVGFGSDDIARGKHRRKYRRTARSISVSVQPLDDDFQPFGDVFWVVSRDVSLRGMGLLSHEPFSQKYVRLGLMDQTASTIAEVVHNTSIGEKYPLFLVGVKFEGKLLDCDPSEF